RDRRTVPDLVPSPDPAPGLGRRILRAAILELHPPLVDARLSRGRYLLEDRPRSGARDCRLALSADGDPRADVLRRRRAPQSDRRREVGLADGSFLPGAVVPRVGDG